VFVALRPPVDLPFTLDRYGRYGDDAANRLEPSGALVRVFPDAVGAPVACRLRAADGGVELETDRPADEAVVAGVRRFCGDDWDLDGVAVAERADPALGSLPRARPPLLDAPFEALVTSITAQQVSMYAATRIRSRVVERFGEPVGFALAFPTPAALAAATEDDLRHLGLSTRKAEYVRGLAALVADGALDLDGLRALPDPEVVERISAVRGLGVWTAEWFLLRSLGRADAFPAGDLGVRKVVASLEGEAMVSEAAARERAARWAPVRGLVTLLLLRALY
jgi:3-methyladenine DNA glycosylase/8-oxoguanine DNA glycosylase